MTPDRRREIEAFAAGAGRDLRVLTDTLAALAAAESRAEQAERESQRLLRLNAAVAGENARLRARLRARLATVEAAGRALIEAWDAEIAAYESEDDVDWGTRMGAAHLRRQQAQEAFRAALAATPARTPDLCALCDRPREPDDDWCSECRAGVDAVASTFGATPAADEPAELSMIVAGDELVLEIDAALAGDGFDPAAPRVRFENVAEVIEWLKSDDDDHRREQQQHGGESGE